MTAGIAQQYLNALQGAAGPPGEARNAALLELEKVATDAGAGYRTLARLREAALQGRYRRCRRRRGVVDAGGRRSARPIRCCAMSATLQWVLHQIDNGDPATLAGPAEAAGRAGQPLARRWPRRRRR